MQKEEVKLKNFLEIPYDQLEVKNVKTRNENWNKETINKYREILRKETRLKAITVCFSDIEGRLHMLDYDKKYLLKSDDNLTFDGSSVQGFTAQIESDLRLSLDWSSIMWLPADVFGPGKVIMFADVITPQRKEFDSDFRARLKKLCCDLKEKNGYEVLIGPEIEGFLLEGIDAEQNFDSRVGFKLISSGGYYHSLPLDKLRNFIDGTAEAQRAMGFINEKDHPEVAPSQFEINFAHTNAIRACDQIQLYKLVCRQVANNKDMTATFLPKPIQNINGSGMHINFSIAKDGKNVFYDGKGKEGLSKFAWNFIDRILFRAPELCLILNSSVNAYRRLDPKFEAPNQIKVSPIDRGAMVRIPAGNEKSARIEIRSVAPDTNPYLAIYSILKAGFDTTSLPKRDKKERLRFLPDTIYDSIRIFKASDFMEKALGEFAKDKYLEPKMATAERNPKELGKNIKDLEILYHHEITNQAIWNSY